MSNISDFCPLWGEWYTNESSRIGKGSFGRVYRAIKKDNYGVYESAVKHIQIPLEDVSYKEIINEEIIEEKSLADYYNSLRDRIINEINICYSLKGNSNIVSFEEHLVVEKPDRLGCDIFIRMEYLESLTDYINRIKCDENTVIKIGLDICEALILLNKRNIIHRNIKLDSIFVNKDGVFKLGDFRESKVLSESLCAMSIRGTYHYMAPEILSFGCDNSTVDIYSLGMVMYRILNNDRPPFVDSHIDCVTSTMLKNSNKKRFFGETMPAPCNCRNVALANIILKACEYNPADRWQSPEEFKQRLLSCYNCVDKSKEKKKVNYNGDTLTAVTFGREYNISNKQIANKEMKAEVNCDYTDNYDNQFEQTNSVVFLNKSQKRNINKTLRIIILVVVLVVLLIPALFFLFELKEKISESTYYSTIQKDDSDVDNDKSKNNDIVVDEYYNDVVIQVDQEQFEIGDKFMKSFYL